MSESVIPETDNIRVAQVTVAWEIIRESSIIDTLVNQDGVTLIDVIEKITNIYIKVYSAISNETPVNLDDEKT